MLPRASVAPGRPAPEPDQRRSRPPGARRTCSSLHARSRQPGDEGRLDVGGIRLAAGLTLNFAAVMALGGLTEDLLAAHRPAAYMPDLEVLTPIWMGFILREGRRRKLLPHRDSVPEFTPIAGAP